MLLAQDVAAAAPTATTTTADSRAQTWSPVSRGGDMQSGEALLIEAYAAIWVVFFLFVLISWRRQQATDARIVELERAVAKARAADEAKAS